MERDRKGLEGERNGVEGERKGVEREIMGVERERKRMEGKKRGGRGDKRGGRRRAEWRKGRELELENFNKNSSVRSIWTYLTGSPCYTTNTDKHE